MGIGILGKKVGMAQIFDEQGQAVAVTVIAAGPCPVVAVRTPEQNGYSAVLLGFGAIKPHKLSKPLKGLFDKHKLEPRRTLHNLSKRYGHSSCFGFNNMQSASPYRAAFCSSS